VTAERREVVRDPAEVVEHADAIETEQAVDEHDRQWRAARGFAGDRYEARERRFGLGDSCGTTSQDEADRDDQQERDQQERDGHRRSLRQ
jgi:hypothetical protein